MTMGVGTLRAASVLFTVVGSCVQRPFCFLWSDVAPGVPMYCVCCFVFFGRSTLRPYMPAYPHVHTPISSHPPHVHHIRYILRGRDAACSVRFVCCFRMLPPASHCIVSVVFVFRTQHAASLLAWQFIVLTLNLSLDAGVMLPFIFF